MNHKIIRAVAALALAVSAGGAGYVAGGGQSAGALLLSGAETDATRIIYSLDEKRNDEELITLIESAKERVYFAIYTFTLPNVADALVEAKKRGVDVRGLMDSEQSGSSYGAPIAAKLRAAGIPLFTERHESGNGIMHIKLLVTEQAYAFGSYNWTKSATILNDEILEIGIDSELRQAYENILKRLFDAYRGSAAAEAAANVSIGLIGYVDAPAHIGERASVRGILVDAHTSASGTVFLDFCKSYKTCPFSGVIFADDAKKFGDLSRYVGTSITISGKISSYQGRAEIILSDPNQISK